jgi:hypothetical protein
MSPRAVEAAALQTEFEAGEWAGRLLRPVAGRDEALVRETQWGLTCRDVIDKVRQRLAHKGHRWD